MPLPKLHANVKTVEEALRAADQYVLWLNDATDELVAHPGYDTMAHAAVVLAKALRVDREASR